MTTNERQEKVKLFSEEEKMDQYVIQGEGNGKRLL